MVLVSLGAQGSLVHAPQEQTTPVMPASLPCIRLCVALYITGLIYIIAAGRDLL